MTLYFSILSQTVGTVGKCHLSGLCLYQLPLSLSHTLMSNRLLPPSPLPHCTVKYSLSKSTVIVPPGISKKLGTCRLVVVVFTNLNITMFASFYSQAHPTPI